MDGVDEAITGKIKCNDFIRKLYKHASQHRLSGDSAFGNFCKQCESLLDMSVGTPMKATPSRAGSRGSAAPASRAGSRPSSVPATPRTPVR